MKSTQNIGIKVIYMIHLLESSLFEGLTGRHFYECLLEYLKTTDKILNADDYVRKHNDGSFDSRRKDDYAREFPVAEIKQDLADFIEDWLEKVKDACSIHKVNVRWDDGKYGFSNYVEICFDRPNDKRLFPYYRENSNLYNNVKFRFSEHNPVNDASDITAFVDFKGKSFEDAADEMEIAIRNYVQDLRAGEKRYIKKLEKEKRRR